MLLVLSLVGVFALFVGFPIGLLVSLWAEGETRMFGIVLGVLLGILALFIVAVLI